ncbi:MAG: PAS domain S-box protein, partial [Spirochaetota bacterium]|nr:PAS domain S-box protein [Spirochaetota bacterium]
MLTENNTKSQQVKYLYNQIYLTIPGILFISAIITLIFWDLIQKPVIITWLSLIFSSLVFRIIVTIYYFKSSPKSRIQKKWEIYFLVIIIYMGIAWGSAGILFYNTQSVIYVAILLLILIGVTAGSLVSSSHLPTISLFMPLVIVPIQTRILISYLNTDNEIFLMFFIVSLFLLIFIYRVGYSFNQLYKESFILANEKNDLISNLTETVRQKSELNKSLEKKIIESERLQKLAMDSESEIKNILKNIQEVIFSSNREGQITWVSDSVEKIFGYKPDEIIGKIYIQDLYTNPRGRDDFIRELKNRKGVISNYTTMIKRKDNSQVWVSINSNFIYDPIQKKVLGVEGTVRDITDMKLARESQLETELKYRDVVSNVPGVVFQLELSADGVLSFPYISYGSMMVLGYEPEEFYANPNLAFELMPPDDLEIVMNDIGITAQTLETSKIQFRMKAKSGSYKWLDTLSTPHKKTDGSIIWYGVIIDVTARKEAEDLLIESEARFKEIANNIPGMVYQFMISSDGEMSFPFISAGGIEILGYSEEDSYLNPKLPFEIVHPDDLEVVNKTIAESAAKLSTWKLDFRMISKDGHTLWMRGTSSPRKTEDGAILWDGVILNISEQKEVEHALKDSETRFRRFFEIGLIGMGVATHNRKWIDVNDKLCDMLGYNRQELLKLGWDDVTYIEDLKIDDEMYHEVLKGALEGYSS